MGESGVIRITVEYDTRTNLIRLSAPMASFVEKAISEKILSTAIEQVAAFSPEAQAAAVEPAGETDVERALAARARALPPGTNGG